MPKQNPVPELIRIPPLHHATSICIAKHYCLAKTLWRIYMTVNLIVTGLDMLKEFHSYVAFG